MLDQTDLQIIRYLSSKGRSQWKEIGTAVSLSGQAVADRVHRMEDLGIIEGYTVMVNESMVGNTVAAIITVFLKSSEHDSFVHFIHRSKEVQEAHRVSGEGCYMLKTLFRNTDGLDRFLENLLQYGNYKVSISINRIK